MEGKKTFEFYKQLIGSGKTPQELIENGWHHLIIARFNKKFGKEVEAAKTTQTIADNQNGVVTPIIEDEDEESDSVISVNIPDAKLFDEPSGKKNDERISSKTIGWLCAAVFMMQANRTQDLEWLLNEQEKKTLGQVGAEALNVVPSPIAKIINQYSAPMVFIAVLMDTVKRKQKQIEAKYERAAKTPRSPVESPYTNGAPEVANAATNTNGKTGVTEPESLGNIFQ